jgi:subtilase family serine protease
MQVLATTKTNVNNLQIITVNDSQLVLPDGCQVNLPLEVYGDNSSEPQALIPANFTTAYNLPLTGGSGTIAIIDPYDDPTVWNDLQNFSQTFNLPFNPSNFEEVQIVPSGENITANINFTLEIALDVEWAHAMAPNAKIMLVEAYDPGYLIDAANWAAGQADVVSISMSWGWSEQAGPFSYTSSNGTFVPVPFSNETYYDSAFTSPNHACFFAGSGDHAENVSWPACSPNVVGVGGTTLSFYSNSSLDSEVVWNDGNGNASGGGVSRYENETSYQLSYGIQGSNGHRGVPDVSFDAGTGVSVYCTSPTPIGTNWLAVGGTSLGAPCWAAIYSLRPTASNPTLYALAKSVYNSSSFRDITNGTNGNYNATAGYDFCTGLGSPLTGAFNSSLPGDLNFDGTVDIYDAVLLAKAYNANQTSTNWNALADINNDGTVDIYDAIILAGHFGETYGAGSDSVSGNSGTQPMQSGGTSVTVDPSSTTVFKGEVFNASVDVSSVTDLLGWEFQLYWNSTMLNCTNVAIQTPSQWQGSTLTVGSGLQENYNATTALYWQGQAGTYPASSFNGSMTMVTLTFQALQPGTTPLTLTDVKLANSTAQPIACSVSSGSVTVNPSAVLTIYASNGGTTNPASGQYSENYGTNVTVTATANSGDTFEYWILDGNEYSNNPITVTMTANHSLTPYFYVPPPGGCVLFGTLITMADGKTVPVQKVKPGDSIMGYDVQTGTFVTETVTSNNCTTVNEVLSINNGLLYVTPTEQPIYTDHGWVNNPQDIMIGWKIYNPTTNTWTTVQSLTTLKGNFQVYDLQATQPNTFIGNGILLDRKT